MEHDPSWDGVGRGLLALGTMWWAWSGYAWLTSVVDPEEGPVRIAMFAVMAALLIVAMCLPEAFGDRALPFAIAYGVVRVGHILLFVVASRDDQALRRSVVTVAVSTSMSVGLLLVASELDGGAQTALWALAILTDAVGPGPCGIEGWRLAPAHFAERHNLVIILALGESIVALGAAANADLSAGLTPPRCSGLDSPPRSGGRISTPSRWSPRST